MIRRSVWTVAIVVAVGLAWLLVWLMFDNPRMRTQPLIKKYQARMPLPPVESVPLEPLPDERVVAAAEQTPPVTPEAIERGRVYYGYYCLFCHGEDGRGNGPVGRSYNPKPADLTAASIGAMSDAELVRAMLTGTGHDPVLEQTVLSERRPYLVVYVRVLAERPDGLR